MIPFTVGLAFCLAALQSRPLHVHVAMSDQLKRPLRIDRAADIELAVVVSASAFLAEVLDFCVDMVGSEAARADALWSACWRDLVDRHRALDS